MLSRIYGILNSLWIALSLAWPIPLIKILVSGKWSDSGTVGVLFNTGSSISTWGIINSLFTRKSEDSEVVGKIIGGSLTSCTVSIISIGFSIIGSGTGIELSFV